MKTQQSAPALIGIDWGSTGLRAWLIDAAGQVLDERTAAGQGASTLHGHDAFAAAYDDVSAPWRAAHPQLPVLACGMVGSTHGWLDVPYLACPADADALAAGIARVPDGPHIVPGLLSDAPPLPPDLMRGEETQILGALCDAALRPASCIVLPGTHSKWAHVDGGRITRFSTYMTGELYALLRLSSVLGRLMPDDAPTDDAAFTQGLDAVLQHGHQGLSHQLFAVRTLGVTGRLAAGGLADYLSGLLIGHELRAALPWRERAGLAQAPLVLVGAPALCARYAQALRHVGVAAPRILGNVAPAGLFALARAAALVAPPAA
jgi:2-dehydro-3-deoxygalactonokinase